MAGVVDTVLFDRIDLRVGAQIVQIAVGELSGVTVDGAKLVGDIHWGGANVGSERHLRFEGNDIPAGDGLFGFRNSEKGGHRGRVVDYICKATPRTREPERAF